MTGHRPWNYAGSLNLVALDLDRVATGCYVNHLGTGELEAHRGYNDNDYSRLAALKTTYDPDNVFQLCGFGRRRCRGGFDTLEHVTFLTADGVVADPATMDAIIESGTVVSATVGELPGVGKPPPAIARHIRTVRENWTRLHRGGARLIPSTDAGIAPFKPHDVLPYGITALTTLGMTNVEALRAARSVAAEACGLTGRKACGLTGRKGRLTLGADADLIAITGNLFDDIHAVHNVTTVVRGGRQVR